MIAITALLKPALAAFVIEQLLKPSRQTRLSPLCVTRRKRKPWSQQGIVVHQGDYTDQAALTTALKGVEKLRRSYPAKWVSAHAAPERH